MFVAGRDHDSAGADFLDACFRFGRWAGVGQGLGRAFADGEIRIVAGQKISVLTLINGDEFSITANGMAVEITDSIKAAVTEARDLMKVARLTALVQDKGFELAALGESKVEDKATIGVRVSSKGKKDVNLYFDKATSRLAKIEHRGFPRQMKLSPDGSKLLIDAGTTIYIHDTTTLELRTKWVAKYSYSPGLAWSPDGRLVGRTHGTTTARIHDAENGRQVMAVGTKRGRNAGITFSLDGLTFAVGVHGGIVREWEVE